MIDPYDQHAEYRAMTPYAKASHEATLWGERSRDASSRRSPSGRTARGIEVLSAILLTSGYEIRQRNALWSAGDIAAPLWARLDRKTLTLAEAVRYLRQAERERKQTRGNVSARLAQLLGASVTVLHPTPTDVTTPPPMDRDAFLSGVRALVGAYAAHALGDRDAPSAARIRKTLEADIALAVSEFHKRTRSQAPSLDSVIAAVPRKRLVEACRTLSMDPPRVGKPVDAAHAKRQYRALARLFHPDVSTEPNAAEVFGNVTDAYKTIDEYNLSLESESSDGAEGRSKGA